jgi:ZIP family zinc transporter
MNGILHILWLSFIPVVATALGSAAAVVRPPGARVKSGIQHFAAGVVFSVVAVELLPHVVGSRTPIEVVLGFAAGIVLMLLLRKWTERTEERTARDGAGTPGTGGTSIPEQAARAASGDAPAGLLVAVGIDILLDGLLLGIAFAAGAKEGILLTLALSLELLSLGLAITASLLDRAASQVRAVVVPVLLALLLCVGAIVGDTVLHNASTAVLATVLSFGCAALLFLVTEELLVEAHEVPETAATTSMFFAGFLLFLVLGMIG